MRKSVQGVQGAVQGLVQGAKPRAAWSVQGVQGCVLTGAREAKKIHTLKNKTTSRVYTHPAHPAHPAQATATNTSRIFAPCTAPCTPCTTLNLLQKIMKLICGKENVSEFNRLFKRVAPEFHSLAKLLHTAGLIDGLRGTTLEIGEFAADTEQTEQPENSYCPDCKHWHQPNECKP